MGKKILGKMTRRCRVLFYAAEDGKKRLRRRVRKIAETAGYDLGELKKWLKVIDASDLDPLYGERLEIPASIRLRRLAPCQGTTA